MAFNRSQQDQDTLVPEGNMPFQKALSTLFLACGNPPTSEKALEFVRNFSRRTFALEISKTYADRSVHDKFIMDLARKQFLPLTHAFSECFVDTLAEAKVADRSGLLDLLVTITTDFLALSSNSESVGGVSGGRSANWLIRNFTNRFINLCHEEDWSKKTAGVAAICVYVHKVQLGRQYLIDIETEVMRALLFCLRDAPTAAQTKDSDEILELMKYLIRTCQSQEDGRPRIPRLTEILVTELHSQSALSRTAAQQTIEVLAEVITQSVSDLISPTAKSRLLEKPMGAIFSKPLRALPIPMQIGKIEAVTYLMQLRPSVIETTDDFVRLLQEVLALADSEDAALIGKPPTHSQEGLCKALRITCLQLLRSAMAAPDFLSKPAFAAMRSR